MVKYLEQEFKTTLNKLKYPDSWFWTRYTINPYSGCEHACIYCDARSKRYYLEQDFENEVIIKTKIDQLLDQRISNARTFLIDVVGAGGVCDCYQPIEGEIKNTNKILHILAKHKYPINIATKSKLILRDLNILKQIAKDTWATVGFSIATLDEDLAKFLEPFSSTPFERYAAIEKIKSEAPEIQVGTYFIPIIPFLEDTDENLEAVIRKSKEVNADFLLFSPGLTLRDNQKAFFIRKIKNSPYKEIASQILKLFKENMYPPIEYVQKLNTKLLKLCKKYKLALRIRRWIPSDYRKWNYKISELLLNDEYIQTIETGKSNRNKLWAGLKLNNLNKSILEVYKRDELFTLPNFNKEIIDFVTPYLDRAKELEPKKGLDAFL